MITPANVAAALLDLIPFLAVGFFPQAVTARVCRLPMWAKLAVPAVFCVPYGLVACGAGIFRFQWLGMYALLPVAIAAILAQAARVDPEQRGNWRDFLILAALGLAVDLRWFEGAWPPHLAVFNKILLLDAGIYGFVLIRGLEGTGFDLRLRGKDLGIGLREAAFYIPIALASVWLSASCTLTRFGRGCGQSPAHGFLLSFLSPFPRSCFFADGCRICWKSE